MRLGSLVVHAGAEPDPQTGAVSFPIYQTSTYVQDGVERPRRGYEYARTQNPTRERWESCVSALEHGKHGVAFASGMASVSALMQTLESGDHVIASDDLYGGSYRVFEQVYRPLGLDFTHVNTSDLGAVEAAIKPNTRYIFLETPTNPLMIVTDIAAVSRLARSKGVLTVVDNTYLSPALQQPLALGADVVLHSCTKYLNGHSDMVGGIIVTSNDDLGERLRFLQNASGGVPGPMDCWLALRGVKTLSLRMQRHSDNGFRVARFLAEHSEVKKVLYPGLPSHPQYEISKKQATGFGGMVACDLGDGATARKVIERTRLFALAESLGGVESLVSHPSTMTHASVPEELRVAKGLTAGIIRFSVGIEDPEDLLEDLSRALDL